MWGDISTLLLFLGIVIICGAMNWQTMLLGFGLIATATIISLKLR